MSSSQRAFPIIAATHTPLSADGSLNAAAVERLARYLVRFGVDGAFVGGTTGEGQSLTLPEREQLAAAWSAAGDGLKIYINVGHNSYRDACQLAGHAASLGVDGIAVQCPSFHKPADVAALIEYCVPVATAAGETPFYLYDIPGLSGVSLPTATFLAEASKRIPTLRGVKYSNPYLIGLQECIQLDGGRFEVYYGSDENMLAALAYGATGAIGSTFNIAAPVYHKLVEAFRAGDFETARRQQFKSVRIAQELIACGVIPASKFALDPIGIDCGPVRPPLVNLTPEQQARTIAMLKEFDLLEPAQAACDA